MAMHFFSPNKKPAGRPPVVELSPDDLKEVRKLWLAGNRTKKDGSIPAAWVRFCEAHPGQYGHLVKDHCPSTTVPTAVVDACRATRALVGPDRGGAARQRHEGAYVPGTMRVNQEEGRRLYAGERASVDDATRNTACYIPWPWGGDACSDRFHVRLGRWQTLIVHDDASGYIPFVSSVFRWSQSYRATDAASVIYRAERDVAKWDSWSIEGGVWQTGRVLDILGGRFISAKGRPNQKLVEGYINRLWDRMAGQRGDVGRHQGEMRKTSELYVKCRNGKEDPRRWFMSLETAQEEMYGAIQWLNEKRIKSKEYGTWVPQQRWEDDLAKCPRASRSADDMWLLSPVRSVRTVRRGMLKVAEDGPLGVRMEWSFANEWLWQHEGRKLCLYFDPMDAWPVRATVTLEGSRKPLGEVECINTFGESRDRAAEVVKAIRNTMMSETRVLSTRVSEIEVRHAAGVARVITGPKTDPAPETAPAPARETSRPAEVSTCGHDRNAEDIAAIAAASRGLRDGGVKVSRDDLYSDVSRRARNASSLI